LLREDTSVFANKVVSSFTKRELKRWQDTYEQFDWSESLAMAARRLANNEGPCEKKGD